MSSRGPLSSRLRYLPLGGLGEVGINMWALEWEDKLLAVDLIGAPANSRRSL